MNLKNTFCIGLALILLMACGAPGKSKADKKEHEQPVQQFSFNWEALAEVIVNQAAIQKNERVFLLAEPGPFDPLVNRLAGKIDRAGGEYLGTFSVAENAPEAWETSFTLRGDTLPEESLQQHLSQSDLGIMMPGTNAGDPVYAAMQNVLRNGSGRTIHFHWAGAFDVHMNRLEPDTTIHAVYQHAVLNTDYRELAARQNAFTEAMRNQPIHVTTPAGTDLTFEIGNRPVNRQNGDASKAQTDQGKTLFDREIELPAGAIRVAPLEETVHGTIAFPDSKWAGNDAKGVVMTVANGKIVDVNAEKGLESVKK